MIQRFVSRIFIIGCVLIFLQLPVFVDQYAIRLEGHLSESRRQIAAKIQWGTKLLCVPQGKGENTWRRVTCRSSSWVKVKSKKMVTAQVVF